MIFSKSNFNEEKLIDTENFKQVLSIELSEKSKENVLKTIEKLKNRDDIYYVGPDYKISMCATSPNDKLIDKQWAVDKIELPKAWDVTTGSKSVTVGVIDTGIDGTHPDLKDNINNSLCRDFSNGNEVTVSISSDPNGHGTHVAGIIGACGNNGVGTTGACWDLNLVSLRIFNANGIGYSSYLVKAIDYASMNNIPILNLSAGWHSDLIEKYYDVVVDSCIKNYSGLFVCAAGNSNANNDESDNFPSNYRLDNLISVGATDKSDNKCDFSNYGKTTVDLYAPGYEIVSTYKNRTYASMSGTSMAAPYVTGVAALVLSKYPDLTAQELKQYILHSVDTVAELKDTCVTGGRLNAYKAVSAIPHTYSAAYDKKDDNTHTAYCVCGESIVEEHNYFHSCEKTSSNKTHINKCACGAGKEQNHVWKAYTKPTLLPGTYAQCIRCGFLKKLGSDEFVPVLPDRKKDTENM